MPKRRRKIKQRKVQIKEAVIHGPPPDHEMTIDQHRVNLMLMEDYDQPKNYKNLTHAEALALAGAWLSREE